MPKPPTGKKYEKKYTENDLSAAVTAIKDGMPKREAARKYSIPRATLQFRLSSDLIKTKPGPSTILTETEEKKLADWIITSSKKGFPRRKEDILTSVEQFMIKTPRVSKFKDNKPGEGWYKLFLKRHPEIVERTAESVTSASANVSEENIKNWFKQIENTLTNEEYKILDDPCRIFNGDETGFQLCPKQGKVLAEKGSKDVYEIDMAAAKSNITVMFTFSASGKVTPPLIIYPLKRMRVDIRRSVPSHWGIALSDNGWMTKEIFFQYVTEILYPHLVRENIKLPVILFVDGHKSHINYELSEKCKELGIVLVALYPNATRILQPADVAAFKPIKNEWKKALLEWRKKNFSKQLTKVDFGGVLTTVVANIKQEGIINGFRACGLYPWNPNAINFAKCLGKQKEAIPSIETCHQKKLTITDFQRLVGSDVFYALQNEATFQDDNFYKALKNVYKFLKDETISDSISISDNDQRRIRIDDEWLQIDDIPFFIVPDAGDGVEDVITATSDKDCKSLANHDITKKNKEIDQNEEYEQTMSKETKNLSETTMEMEHQICIETQETHEDLKKLEQIIVQLDSIDSFHKTTSSGEIDEFLFKAPTPKRKGKILPQHSSIYVMTSDKWLELEKQKHDEKEKAIAVKLERKRIRELAKEAKLLKKTETQNKKLEKRKYTVEKGQDIVCKNRKICVKKSKETDIVINETKKFSCPKMIRITDIETTDVNKNKINIDDPKNNKVQNITLKSDDIHSEIKDKTDTIITEVTENLNMKIIDEKGTTNEKFKTINTKIEAEVNKKHKTYLKNSENRENSTEKHSTKKENIIEADKIHFNENEINFDAPKSNKRQNRLKSDETYRKLKDETDSTLSKETEITNMNTIEEKDIIREKAETLKPGSKNSRVNVLSVVPILVNPADNVKRRLFDDTFNVKPSEYILKASKIIKRRSTFRTEKELEDFLNNECDDRQ